MTKIAWTDKTWNPVTGCDPISAGCDNCYAKNQAIRLQRWGTPGYEDGFAVRCHSDRLEHPLKWVRPKKIFICSMADLFHEQVPDEFIYRVLAIVGRAEQHTFQILTKRPERMCRLLVDLPILPNLWLGVTVEDQRAANKRIKALLSTPTAIRFVSIEPILGPVNLRCTTWYATRNCIDALIGWEELDEDGVGRGLDWVICGGETGSKAKPANQDWIRSLLEQCRDTGTPFFFKQIGGMIGSGGCLLDGREYKEFPQAWK